MKHPTEVETNTELLPCPFCGGTAEIEPYKRNGYKLKCLNCTIQYRQLTIHKSLEWLRAKMIENWNKKNPIPSIRTGREGMDG